MTSDTAAGTASSEQRIADFLRLQGASPAAVAGILGNFQVESGFDPAASNPAEGAIGLAQWEGGRRTALDAYAAATHGSETSLATQLGYLMTELQGRYAGVWAAIRNATDPARAAALWDVGPGGPNSGTGFENSSGSATAERMNNARSIYQQITTGQVLTGGSAAGPVSGPAGASGLADLGGGGILGAVSPVSWFSELLPWNWGKTLNGAAQGILATVVSFLLKMAFVGAGATLVVLGAWRASAPARDQAERILPAAAAL